MVHGLYRYLDSPAQASSQDPFSSSSSLLGVDVGVSSAGILPTKSPVQQSPSSSPGLVVVVVVVAVACPRSGRSLPYMLSGTVKSIFRREERSGLKRLAGLLRPLEGRRWDRIGAAYASDICQFRGICKL
jgi:hypothetical protein